MSKPPLDAGTRAVLEAQKRREIDARREAKRHRKYKRWQEERVKARQWPLDATTGLRAEVDPEDVNAPLPFDVKEITAEDIAAANAVIPSEFVEVDENVLANRRAQREKEIAARNAVVGEQWTEDLVEARVEEAFKVLGRLAVGPTGPREFGNGMPTPLREMSDLVHQAGNKSLRNAMRRIFRDEGPPSGPEVARMQDAIGWAAQYLRDYDPDLALFLNMSGLWKSGGRKVTRECEKMGVDRRAFYKAKKQAVKIIVEGLKRDGRAPT